MLEAWQAELDSLVERSVARPAHTSQPLHYLPGLRDPSLESVTILAATKL